MNLLSHSNGMHKIEKEKMSILKIFKRVIIFLVYLIIAGFVIQIAINFIDNNRLKSRFKYVRVDGKKMEYRIKGNGTYTIVFDGSIGTDSYEWDEICKQLEENKDVITFTYNRRGYGFNDGGELRTPEEQAKDLKTLLKKSGAPEPYILVGEEYGSLVATNFMKLYPSSVAGTVFIDPISEEKINSNEFKHEIKSKYLRSRLELLGSNFTLTYLMNKLGLTMENDTFKNSLTNSELDEFKALETKKPFKEAVYNEIKNLYDGKSESQTEGLLSNKPMYVISHDKDGQITSLGDTDNTTIINKDTEKAPYSVVNPEAVVNGINSVVKEVQKKS